LQMLNTVSLETDSTNQFIFGKKTKPLFWLNCTMHTTVFFCYNGFVPVTFFWFTTELYTFIPATESRTAATGRNTWPL
jgi:hypothetical protein